MNQEVITTANETGLAIFTPDMMGGFENILREDIRCPKILIVQGNSKIKEKPGVEARDGEVRESLEGNLIAKKEECFTIVPFANEHKYSVFSLELDKFHKEVPYESTRKRHYYSKDEDGKIEADEVTAKYKNERICKVYAFLRGQPLTQAFQISFKGGPAIAAFTNIIEMNIKLKIPYFARPLQVASKTKRNDRGHSWFAFDFFPEKDSAGKTAYCTQEEALAAKVAMDAFAEAFKNGTTITSGSAVDDSDEAPITNKF